jgi:hypothetical protein
MVAAKLLVELGCPAQDALNRVRGARPGVLQQPEEEEFVRGQAPAAEAAFGTHVSLVQPLTVGHAAARGEEPEPDSALLPFDNPNQLDLLRTSQKD